MKYKSFHLLYSDVVRLEEKYPNVYDKLKQISKALVFVELPGYFVPYIRVDVPLKEKRSEIKQLIRELVLQIYFNCRNKGDYDFQNYMLLSDLHAHLVLLL